MNKKTFNMNLVDKQYKELISKILSEGVEKQDRTGVGTKSIFGHQMSFNMSDGFPLLTLRKIHIRSVIHEMLWFLGSYEDEYNKFGNTNIRYLLDHGVTFWSEWPYQNYMKSREYRPELPEFTIKEFESKIMLDDKFAIEFGSIGKGYGHQWLNYGGEIKRIIKNGVSSFEVTQGINQIDNVIEILKKNPDSRRIIVDSWNPLDLPEMLLPPCHMMFQFNTYKMDKYERMKEFKKWISENNMTIEHPMDYYDFPTRKLSLQMYQRSVDSSLGWPFNVAEYSLLLYMVSQVVNMIPDKFVWTGGDIHIYNNHINQMIEVSNRDSFSLPNIRLNKNIKNIYDFRFEDIEILNYKSHPNIKMDVAV